MVDTTNSSLLFLESALDIAARVGKHRTAQAIALAREADALVTQFRTWRTVPPDDATRVATIQQLFDLNRRAMEFLAAQGPSSGVRTKTFDRGLMDADDDDRTTATGRRRA